MTSLPRPVIVLLLAAVLLAGCSTPTGSNGTPPPADDGDPPPDPDDGPPPDPSTPPTVPSADPATLMDLVERQVYENGPTDQPRYRTPGTPGHAEAVGILEGMLTDRNLTVEHQRFRIELGELGTVNATNLYGIRQGASDQEVWLAAHWDSRAWADGPPDQEACTGPEVLGANDGAAAVAVVLHAIDLLEPTNLTIRVALFDVEDQGGCPGTGWALGSEHAAEQLTEEQVEDIRALLLVDMPGDENLIIRREGYSQSRSPALTDRVFEVAAALNATSFLDERGPSITDDHVPFLDRGIPAVDLIHLDCDTGYNCEDPRRGPFPWTHHTVHDTPENLSGEKMAEVTEVVVGTVLDLDRASKA